MEERKFEIKIVRKMHKQELLMNKLDIIVKKKHSKFQYLGLSLLDKLKCIDDDNHDPLYQDNNINFSYHRILLGCHGSHFFIFLLLWQPRLAVLAMPIAITITTIAMVSCTKNIIAIATAMAILVHAPALPLQWQWQ